MEALNDWPAVKVLSEDGYPPRSPCFCERRHPDWPYHSPRLCSADVPASKEAR